MEDKKWTEAQKAAIIASGSNMLVSAAAGSGKTAVMIEKIFNLINDGKTSVDRLVVVTYTNAAASSMRKKLKEKFDSVLNENPNDQYLLKQKRMLDRANISTIHSFCQKLLQRYYCKTDLAPDFAILNATQEKMYSEYAINKTLEEYAQMYSSGNYPNYLDALKHFSNGYDDGKLADKVIEFTKKMSYIIDKQTFRDKVLELFGNSGYWDNLLCNEIDKIAKMFIDYYEFLITKFKGGTNFDIVLSHANNIIDLFEKVFDAKTPNEKIKALRFHAGTSQAKFNKKNNEEYAAISKNILSLRGKIGNKIIGEIIELSDEEKQSSQNAVKALFDFSEKYQEYFDKKCNENGAVSFDGILDRTMKLLIDEAKIKQELRDEIDYIFIDEYQDVNAKLEKIVTELSQDDNLFFVGDVKQSIYKFNEAKPQLFINKVEEYQNGVLGKIFYLSNNFRSLKSILDGINQIFEECMNKEFFEVEYDNNAKLYPGPEKDTFQYKGAIITNGVKENTNEFLISYKGKGQDGELSEAEVIASRIVELCNNSVLHIVEKDKNNKTIEYDRKVKYSDIVLLGNKNDMPKNLDETFKRYGIPFKFTESIDKESFDIIGAIISLLRLLVIRRDDNELIPVMLSCIGCFTLEDLAKIRIEKNSNEYKILYNAVIAYKSDGSDRIIKDKIDKFEKLLDKLQALELTMTLPDFIEYVYNSTGFKYQIAFMENNYIQENKIQILISNAKYYSENNTGGLRGFLEYYKNIAFAEKNDANFDKNDNSVHYLTIHRSKGLEFPIVFIIGTNEKFKFEKSGFDEKLGFCFKTDTDDENKDKKSNKKNTSQTAVFDLANRYSAIAEKLRLLYVGMTRAQYKLIISVNEAKNTVSNCAYPSYPITTFTGNTFSEILLPIIFGSNYGLPLRNYISEIEDGESNNNDDLWDVKIVKSVNEPNIIVQESEKFGEDAYLEQINVKLNWTYNYLQSTSAKTKQNPSKGTEHKSMLLRKPEEIDQDIEYKGSQKGTIVHFFMEHFDFSSDKSPKNQAKEMLSEGIISEKEFNELPFEQIEKFTDSEFAKRMKKADKDGKLYRERPFCQTVSIPNTKDEALVQGTIDCYFFENDYIVLLDYKTDKINGRINERIEHHLAQLNMYKEALQNLYDGKKVMPYLHFFETNDTIDLNNYQK